MFTDTLKEQTSELHAQAEKTQFMQQLFTGALPLSKYLQYLVCLKSIYLVLEREIRKNVDGDIVKFIFDPRLERKSYLTKDIRAIGKGTVLPISVIKIIKNYADLIVNSSEAGLAAHHYIRYLGDLSGGQILSRVLQKSYGFSEDQMSFYKFDLDINQYRGQYKKAINDAIVSQKDQQDFVDTANSLYSITIKLLDEIMAS